MIGGSSEAKTSKITIFFLFFNLFLIFSSAHTATSDVLFGFVMEFGYDSIYGLFAFVGIVVAGALWFKLFRKIDNPYFFCFFNLAIGVTFFLLIIFPEIWGIIIFYFAIGFFGIVILAGNVFSLKKITNLENRGKIVGLIIAILGIMVVFQAILSSMFTSRDLFLLMGCIFAITGLFSIYLNKKYPFIDSIEKKEIIIQTLTRRDIGYYCLATFVFFIAIGVCVVQVMLNFDTHNISIECGKIFLGDNAVTLTAMQNTNLYVGISIAIFAIPIGVLIDYFGRKEIYFIGLLGSCAGAFFFAFIYDAITLIIGWFFIGLGLSVMYNLTITLFIDIDERKYKSYIGFSWVAFCGGLGSGILIGWVTQGYLTSFVALIILFLFPTAIFAIIHAQDSLPSKEERQWRYCINHLFLIYNDVCITHHPFGSETIVDEQLFAGGISGMISFVQELTKSSEKLETFSQKDTKILIQYGPYITATLIATHDLKILHHKLKDLIYDYEDLFHDYLKNWTGEIDRFALGSRLILRHFT